MLYDDDAHLCISENNLNVLQFLANFEIFEKDKFK